MSDLFRAFLKSLPIRGGYCLDCLSKIYGEPSDAISGYLRALGLSGHQAACANCEEHRETFRFDPSS